ncbi:MAG TPA: hypothetical protein DGR97_11770 [Gammaproteobacteria bacterium]|nr:hypothetical protein [Gammaproteobacteria bacterium]|tara:strand:+ start:108 stop:545 length:438 start_codon:yes stop_codon:yes gene_type:complete
MIGYTRRWATLSLILMVPYASFSCGSIEVLDAWIREPPPVSTVAAGYFTLKNNGSKSAVIERIEGSCCAEVTMHQVLGVHNQKHMAPMPKLLVPPNKIASFTPGNAHLMLVSPNEPLQHGQSVELNFICNDGTSRKTDFTVVYGQ